MGHVKVSAGADLAQNAATDRSKTSPRPAFTAPALHSHVARPAQRLAQGNRLERIVEDPTSGKVFSAPREAAFTASTIAPNRTGLPDRLKAGVEGLSGFSLDDVRVHYNSPKPAELHAMAYAQGAEIHLGPGQERHLPHEAWHVVQQKQGRVKPTLQTKGVPINDDSGLEREADVMGDKAWRQQSPHKAPAARTIPSVALQRVAIEPDDLNQDEYYYFVWGGKNYSAQYRGRNTQNLTFITKDPAHIFIPGKINTTWRDVDAKLPTFYDDPRDIGLSADELETNKFLKEDAEKKLEELSKAFYSKPHEIIIPYSKKGSNCHGFTINLKTGSWIDGEDLLNLIENKKSVVFCYRGSIAHSGRIISGKLHHFLIGVGVLISTIGPRDLMGYDHQFTLPDEKDELTRFLQPKKDNEKIKVFVLNTRAELSDSKMDEKIKDEVNSHLDELMNIADGESPVDPAVYIDRIDALMQRR